jgi:hypothetical protein
MPFRCKCGRTFEKVDTFGSHTSGCAPFHHKRHSISEINNNNQASVEENKRNLNKKRLSIQTDPNQMSYFNQRYLLLSPLKGNNEFFTQQQEPKRPPLSAPVYDGYSGFMMPTALSIQNTFEGVRKRRSMSYSSTQTPM